MAAPRSRRLRNQTAPVTHTRREWALAIGGSAAVVIVTIILIWAMRPGNTLSPGSGGIIHRQTKASLWLLATLAAVAIVSWLVLRPESKLRNPLRALLLSISGVVIAAVVVMAVWHNSLVHDYSVPTVPTTPTSLPVPSSTAPTASSTSTPKSNTTVTTAPRTTSPPTTAATATTGG